ncbi:DUF1090 domain-containing protein [Shewanella psychropiezotolerans]|uniref:DUF1090 domain-containing protein n=1 Tax=Shewanella psychropiezotolerans TaxID=2593655 RepID=A0ABX5WV34_9GAMM|nr:MULTISPECIES: DUF1090 domain-containing protein [Shewanella]MPY23002.1 DUF1090 domain-containing protein [Shewanella sp. YLB-07]QDO82666.1 DUF1090 domain-containing protein [Shewanella psychropiezotolerans]
MKVGYKSGLFVLACVSSNVFASDCRDLKACERKFCEINYQLSIAESKNNEFKVDGLNKALKYAKENCSIQGLRDDLLDKIDDKMEDIEEYRQNLNEAESDNETDKIEKYQRKIKEKEEDISELEIELTELQ